MNKETRKLRRKDGIAAGLMLSPALFFLILTSVYPFAWLFKYILYDYNGFTAFFIGLDNFKRAFTDTVFWRSVLHTFEYASLKLVFVIPFALVMAAMVRSHIPGNNIFKIIFFLPTVISSSISSLIFTFIFSAFNGPLNAALMNIGILKAPIDWLGDPRYVMSAIIIVAFWGGIGNYMIYFLSGLSSISNDVYESCKIDGANAVQTFFKITLPMLSPILKVILMLAITSAFKDYQSILVLTQGGPDNRSQVMFSYIYNLIFPQNALPQIGYGTVLSIIAAMIIGVITVIYNKIAKKLDDVV